MKTKNIKVNKLTFIRLSNENIDKYKSLRKIFAKYKIQTLRNHGESPGSKKMFYNLFDNIIANVSGDKSKYFIIMQADKELLGFALIDTADNDIVDIPFSYGSVLDFYISPKHRRKGFGRMLNDYIENIFKENAANTVLLYPDPVSGIPFWKAMGYCDTGIHQGWGHFLVYIKHITENEHTTEVDKQIQNLVTPTDLIGINPYNKPQIKEVAAIWKEYCKETNRRPHKSDVKKMAFHARKNRDVSFNALYFESKIIGLVYIGEETIRYILPAYRNRDFAREMLYEINVDTSR